MTCQAPKGPPTSNGSIASIKAVWQPGVRSVLQHLAAFEWMHHSRRQLADRSVTRRWMPQPELVPK